MSISVPVSWGELIDKITILEIKQCEIKDETALANVRRELAALTSVLEQSGANHPELAEKKAALLEINRELWGIEDDIRDCERGQDFGDDFIRLARAVYHTNDRRAAVKKEINILLGSELVEEKSYQDY
ncbi:DUF6165 family protein [Aestuariispira insulae]|uniref:Uncharacterized protein n=1 Tax=Aestuariispira insulae TaxID=1461337 RepID=A0A3D9HU28_9PROT|nr:DUF6165 family protein [Aestuariispira insulae]RED52386.1 hypothetical protein DFP90_102407 [Aestuariispira insulae]